MNQQPVVPSMAGERLEPQPQPIRAIIARCLHRAVKVYERNLTPDTLAIYVDCLEDLTNAQVNEGLNRCLRESKFFPRPSELRQFCTGVDPAGVEANNAGVLERLLTLNAAKRGESYNHGVYSSDAKPAMAAFRTRQRAYIKSRPWFTFFTDFEPGHEVRFAAAVASDKALAISRRQLPVPDDIELEQM
jgi:hypothetical protein